MFPAEIFQNIERFIRVFRRNEHGRNAASGQMIAKVAHEAVAAEFVRIGRGFSADTYESYVAHLLPVGEQIGSQITGIPGVGPAIYGVW